MKNRFLIFIVVALGMFSCRAISNSNIFGKKTPHEKYAAQLDDKGLDKTPEGQQWLALSKNSVEAPVQMDLPFELEGRFASDKPRALGLSFSAPQGQRLHF